MENRFMFYNRAVDDIRLRVEALKDKNPGLETVEARERLVQRKFIQMLLNTDNPNAKNKTNIDKYWVLVQAARFNHAYTVEALITQIGADVNARVQLINPAAISLAHNLDLRVGETAFSVALHRGHWELATVLMKYNADPTMGSYEPRLPIFSAASISRLDLFKRFMTYIVDEWKVNPHPVWTNEDDEDEDDEDDEDDDDEEDDDEEEEENDDANAVAYVTNYRALEWFANEKERGPVRAVKFWDLDGQHYDNIVYILAEGGLEKRGSNFDELVSDVDECRAWVRKWWGPGKDPFMNLTYYGAKSIFEAVCRSEAWNHLSLNEAIRLVRNVAILCNVETELPDDLDIHVPSGVLQYERLRLRKLTRDVTIVFTVSSYDIDHNVSIVRIYALLSICGPNMLKKIREYAVANNKVKLLTALSIMTLETLTSTRTFRRIGFNSPIRKLPEDLLRKLKTLLI